MARRHGEGADPVRHPAVGRRYEVGQRKVGPARLLGHLLPQGMNHRELIPPAGLAVHLDIVPHGRGWEEADHAPRPQGWSSRMAG